MELLIAGAGVAGLSAALALTRAGHQVVVTERATELREIGAALSIWPNAQAALDLLGVGQEVRAAGLEAPTGSIHTTSGATLVRIDTEGTRRALGGLPVVMLRAGLQRVLLDACARLGVEIELGRAVVDVRPHGTRVRVRTTGGEATFDGLIGADGIGSAVRDAVMPEGRLRDCDRVAWRAVMKDEAGLVDRTWLSVGTGLQLIASPAPEGLVYWAADTPGCDHPDSDGADRRDILRRRFAGWHPPIPQLIEATAPESLVVTRIFDRPPPAHLRKGPVLLVGDAAHAMTPDLGQGACQAIEDGAVLAACAAGRPDADPATLFEAFEQVRLKRVRRIVRDSYLIGRLATTPSRLAAGGRDVITRILPEPISNRRLGTYASSEAFHRQLPDSDHARRPLGEDLSGRTGGVPARCDGDR